MGRIREFGRARLRRVRSFRVKGFENHLIFHSPIPEGVEVRRVLHAAQNLERFWKDGPWHYGRLTPLNRTRAPGR